MKSDMVSKQFSLRVICEGYFIDPYSIIRIYVRTCVCMSAQLHVFCGKNFFNVGQYMHTSQPKFFIPAIFLGTIYFCYRILLSLTLTLPGGHKVSTKHNLLASFLALFFCDQDEI